MEIPKLLHVMVFWIIRIWAIVCLGCIVFWCYVSEEYVFMDSVLVSNTNLTTECRIQIVSF